MILPLNCSLILAIVSHSEVRSMLPCKRLMAQDFEEECYHKDNPGSYIQCYLKEGPWAACKYLFQMPALRIFVCLHNPYTDFASSVPGAS